MRFHSDLFSSPVTSSTIFSAGQKRYCFNEESSDVNEKDFDTENAHPDSYTTPV